ncbi:hypothetical protein BHE74_00031791, partial [Ensete ventricosum]
ARERKRHGRWSKRMPLVRLELRDDYGLGDPVLYRGGFRKEEPKAILDGVAVSGLVGILRQLGDVAKLVLLASLGPVYNLPDVLCESDDDTFRRSYPYSSEELLSPRSYTSSEQWEQEGRSEYVDHELNDVPDRFQSSTTSISRPMDLRK